MFKIIVTSFRILADFGFDKINRGNRLHQISNCVHPIHGFSYTKYIKTLNYLFFRDLSIYEQKKNGGKK